MNNEIWKDVVGYEGIYEVSNYGRVKNIRTDHVLKPLLKKTGYVAVVLYKNTIRKDWLIHRLVAIAFISNPKKKEQVNHIDEVKTNNCVDNLEWVSPKENANFGTRNIRFSKKHMKTLIQMDFGGKVIREFTSTCEAEKETGLLKQCIARAARGERKQYGGYIWKYIKT